MEQGPKKKKKFATGKAARDMYLRNNYLEFNAKFLESQARARHDTVIHHQEPPSSPFNPVYDDDTGFSRHEQHYPDVPESDGESDECDDECHADIPDYSFLFQDEKKKKDEDERKDKSSTPISFLKFRMVEEVSKGEAS
jgi:hypothetical protein